MLILNLKLLLFAGEAIPVAGRAGPVHTVSRGRSHSLNMMKTWRRWWTPHGRTNANFIQARPQNSVSLSFIGGQITFMRRLATRLSPSPSVHLLLIWELLSIFAAYGTRTDPEPWWHHRPGYITERVGQKSSVWRDYEERKINALFQTSHDAESEDCKCFSISQLSSFTTRVWNASAKSRVGSVNGMWLYTLYISIRTKCPYRKPAELTVLESRSS